MYQVQGLVLEHNVLGKIFFRSDNTEKIESSSVTVGGQSVTVPSSNPDDYINVVGGSVTATTIWQAFFYPAPDSGKTAEEIASNLYDKLLLGEKVADIIISDDNFSTIVLAIEEGRTIYQNITKTMIFLISTNLVEVLGCLPMQFH